MDDRELFLNYCFSLVGTPYVWAGENASLGYDCSGFAQEILRIFGKDPRGDQSAQGLYDHFVSRQAQQSLMPFIGHLCFYGQSTSRITHVAVCISHTHIIEAGGAGSNSPTPKEAGKITAAMVRIRPVSDRHNMVATLSPKIFD